MHVSVETIGSLGRKLSVSVPAERLESAVGHRLRELSRTVRLNGFRPGKVPVKVIEQRFGQQVRSEVYSDVVRDSFGEALRQQNLQPVGQPEITAEGAPAEEIRYTATFEVAPDFGPIDVSALEIQRPVAQVEESDIDTMIETLRQQRRSWNVVERAAAEGDLVNVENFALVEGARFPAEGVERGATVVGSQMLFPAIEQAVVGMRAGEEKLVEVAFPADWRVPELAGKTAQVSVKVVKVSEPHLPAVDEAFIKSFGVKSGTLEQFREEVRSNLARELKGALSARLRVEVAKKLVAAYAHVELPPRLVEAEARAMAAQAAENARRQGQAVGEVDHAPFMEAARNRVAAGLLVGEVARQNELRLDPKRVNEAIALIASTYEDPQQVVDLYRNDPNLMQGLQARVMEEQVIDWIAERARATEVAMSFTDALRPNA
ncbi:trigger factor [Silanimonas lenta]|jgi:trigger factor|uniref:trigger factor n=1 Tax=Silanimonas lenta TaxID=265429 RepID=UPI000409E9FC|nr:trigger factor [Silanimonas lenta]